MRRIMASAALLGAIVTNSYAADLPAGAPPTRLVETSTAYDWTGFYLGINAGYAFGSGADVATLTGNALLTAITLGAGNMNGAEAGGQVGYNWQTGPMVIGLEADGQWSGQKTSASFSCGGGCVFTERFQSQWFATARARAGAAFDRVFLYGTGGLAVMNLSMNISSNVSGATNLASLSQTQFGWVAGAGVEVGITRNISAKAEYLYIDSGAITASAPFSPAYGGGTVDLAAVLHYSIVRVGLNARF